MGMMPTTNLNIVDLLRDGLSTELKGILEKELIDQEMAEYKAKIEPRVKLLVSRVTLESIDTFRDLSQVRDELHVYMHWNDDAQGVEIKKPQTGRR